MQRLVLPPYYLGAHKPIILATCGHSVCANCLELQYSMLRMAAFLVGLMGPLVQKVYENVRSISKFPINNSIIKLIEENLRTSALNTARHLSFIAWTTRFGYQKGNMLDLRSVGHTQATQDTSKRS